MRSFSFFIQIIIQYDRPDFYWQRKAYNNEQSLETQKHSIVNYRDAWG